MRKLNLVFALTTTLLSCLNAPSFAADAPPPASLCTATEKTYLSCETENHKILSLCGALPNALQYRFGRPSRVELRYPEDASKGTSTMAYARDVEGNDDSSDLNFTHGSYHYQIFDLRHSHGDRYTGVIAQGKDQVEHKVVCTSKVQGNLDEVGKYLKCDPNDPFNGGTEDGCHGS
ncbi:hypothetical protein [Dyella acidisoli]|uniref:Uncharacterized protein n=1 Tax=Dyella acidisoli TaxID=1867834 RepID=A0ABQ5XHM5_9GAMM|nr:hypothetical protein [Dyella acidisoli]GLQ91196.1 hypothetical protein GCM10007901_01460 [Dyella acidisoli]